MRLALTARWARPLEQPRMAAHFPKEPETASPRQPRADNPPWHLDIDRAEPPVPRPLLAHTSGDLLPCRADHLPPIPPEDISLPSRRAPPRPSGRRSGA